MNMLLKRLTLCFPLLLLLCFTSSLRASAYHEVAGDSYDTTAADYNVPYILPEQSPSTDAAAAPPDIPAPIRYEVCAGDTLYKIAKSFGVSVQDLMTFNEIDEPNRLAVGQRLDIPPDLTGVELGSGQGGVIRQVLQTTLTAYTAGYESTGKTPSSPDYGITASGSTASEGRTIAVDPSLIPIGSMVFIDGIGIRKAEDTGSAIRGARIDVFMDDVNEARKFGIKKNVKVYVFTQDAGDAFEQAGTG